MNETRRIGSLETPSLILGGNVFGWTTDETTGFAVLDAFVAGGGRMIDTADAYSAWVPGHRGGESESMIGAWLKRRGRQNDVMITTKVGKLPGEGGKSIAPTRIAAAIDESLSRLGRDHVDLYLAHHDDDAFSQDEVAAAFDMLVKAGKVREIGASNFSAGRLASAVEGQTAAGRARYVAVQNEYHLLDRQGYEGALQTLCIERGIAMTPFYGLANGYLTGKYRTEKDLAGKTRGGRVEHYMRGDGPRVLAALDDVADALGATQAQVALAWIAAQPGVAAPIASATSVQQAEDLVGSMHLTLGSDHLARLSEATRIEVQDQSVPC